MANDDDQCRNGHRRLRDGESVQLAGASPQASQRNRKVRVCHSLLQALIRWRLATLDSEVTLIFEVAVAERISGSLNAID